MYNEKFDWVRIKKHGKTVHSRVDEQHVLNMDELAKGNMKSILHVWHNENIMYIGQTLIAMMLTAEA